MTEGEGESSGWPVVDPPDSTRSEKVFEAQVTAVGDRLKAKDEQDLERLKVELAKPKDQSARGDARWELNRKAEIDNLAKFFDTMSALSTGAIDRARAGAELVQKASAAIATLYTGTLALVFSVTDNPLPARGVLAPVFLGLAVVLSTAYVAYLAPKEELDKKTQQAEGLEPKTFERLNAITRISSRIVARRSYALRASVIALGVGLAFIVLPFVDFSHTSTADAQTQAVSDVGDIDWPDPPPGNPGLAKILYQAQVDEVVKARAAADAPARDNDGAVLLIGSLVGLALVFGGAAVTSGTRPGKGQA